MSTRWECPNGCGAVLGPTRPRTDHTCRFCLDCSAKSKNDRLVRRVATTLERRKEKKMSKAAKRAERAEQVMRDKRAAERARAAASAAAVTAKQDADARVVEAKRSANEAARKQGWEYLIVPASADDDSFPREVFGADQFGAAWARLIDLGEHARLQKLYEDGWLLSAIRGNVVTTPKARTYQANAKKALFTETLIGWNRIEPVYTGDSMWRMGVNEREWLFGDRKVILCESSPIHLRNNQIVYGKGAKRSPQTFNVNQYDGEVR